MNNMFSQIKSCFAKDTINLGRQKELDIAKGIAVIFMVLCHGLEIMSWFFDPEISYEISYFILDVVLGGSFAAPVFMFCMGLSFAYSRKSDAGDMFRRAVKTAGISAYSFDFSTIILMLCERASTPTWSK